MGEIKSNKVIAQDIATNLANALQVIQNTKGTSLDTVSTIAGNQKAHEILAFYDSLVEDISGVVASATKNIQSVAEEFEAVDQKVQDEVGQHFDSIPKFSDIDFSMIGKGGIAVPLPYMLTEEEQKWFNQNNGAGESSGTDKYDHIHLVY